jgi:hypothetical protein
MGSARLVAGFQWYKIIDRRSLYALLFTDTVEGF